VTRGRQANVQVWGRAGNSPTIVKPSEPIAKAPRAYQTTIADAGFTGKNAPGSSARPRRIADPSACVWQVKSGVVVVNVVEIDGAVRRERLL
jgi:hypothetical protein